MAADLYAVLGLSRSASADDLKKAYRKLSKEWHPDKHKGDKAAETKFKEINEAYEVLNNPEKRKQYDQFGTTGNHTGGGRGFGGADFGGFDFSQFTNGGDMGDLFQSFFGGRREQRNQDGGSDHTVQLSLSLTEAFTGVTTAVRIKRWSKCETCHGSGGKPGTSAKTCATCGGTGQVIRTVQSFFGSIRQQSVCTECGGSGKIPEKNCDACDGEGRVRRTDEVRINIPAGINTGQTLRVRGEGDAGRRGAPAGDLLIHVRVQDDARFERDGEDVRSRMTLHVWDAILGTTATIETLHGNMTVEISAGTQSGTVLRLKGKGLPHLGRSGHGDHFVELTIEIPKKLSKKEEKLVQEWRDEHK